MFIFKTGKTKEINQTLVGDLGYVYASIFLQQSDLHLRVTWGVCF